MIQLIHPTKHDVGRHGIFMLGFYRCRVVNRSNLEAELSIEIACSQYGIIRMTPAYVPVNYFESHHALVTDQMRSA